MKTIYAIPNFECNLSCPHCEIRKQHSEYDSKKFLNALSVFNIEDMIILFGGEPLLYYDRFIACLQTHKIKTVSTNLLLLTQEIINDLKTYKISLTTSWNLLRFTDQQQTLWIDKLRLLSQNSLKTQILMTMTKI